MNPNKLFRMAAILGTAVSVLISVLYPAVSAQGMVPYKTYTYDVYGNYYLSPNAYEPSAVLDAGDFGPDQTALNSPGDLAADGEGNLYLCDTGNSRILVLDSEYRLTGIIDSFAGEGGNTDTFREPAGIFVTRSGLLYVADSKNSRIVVLDADRSLVRVIPAPASDILPDGFIYEPSALAVDPAGRIYVISKSTNMGVIALSPSGEFEGFIGAEKVTKKVTELLLELITTKEQKRRSSKNVPTEYNNITIDEKGFPYVTASSIKAEDQRAAMMNNDGTGANLPVKKLNPAGVDVLRRNWVFAPAGDIRTEQDVSRFIDVALGEDGVYSVLDQTDKKIFTYDINGNLLYAFGGYGMQAGLFQNPVSLCYRGTDLLVLDANTGKLTVFRRTHYGDSIALALHFQNSRDYTEAAKQWEYVLTLNSSFDQAYSGVASACMRLENYKDAMHYYKTGNYYEGYEKAWAGYRKELIRDYFLLIPIGAAVLIFLFVRLSRHISAVNARGWKKQGKRTLREELYYSYYTMFHPFDGFYDLKHEHRGGMRAACVLFALALLQYLFRQIAGGYIFFGSDWRRVSLADAFFSVGLILLLWVVANWALTTLMNGKGTMKDIFITTCYAMAPMILTSFAATVLSNFVTQNEIQFITFLDTFGLLWSLLLVFFGVLTTNQYSLLKNTLTTIFSAAGMGFLAFLGILFFNVMQRMYDFAATIAAELMYRL